MARKILFMPSCGGNDDGPTRLETITHRSLIPLPEGCSFSLRFSVGHRADRVVDDDEVSTMSSRRTTDADGHVSSEPSRDVPCFDSRFVTGDCYVVERPLLI